MQTDFSRLCQDTLARSFHGPPEGLRMTDGLLLKVNNWLSLSFSHFVNIVEDVSVSLDYAVLELSM